MTIPPEIQPLISQVRRQYPQLAHLPDESIAELILQTLLEQHPRGKTDIGSMSAYECGVYGEHLLSTGRWQEAESFFLAQLEKGERENNLDQQMQAYIHLGRLCRDRGDLPHAMTLYQQALTLAEQLGDRRLRGVIYDQLGTTYHRQGSYSEAMEYYRKSLEIDEQRGDERGLAVSYINLGTMYVEQRDYDRALQAYRKSLEYSTKLGMERESARAYGNLGVVYREQGQYDLAIKMFEKSLVVVQK